MRLCFTVDALIDSGKEAWRLLEDRRQWRSATFAEDMRRGDALLCDTEALRAMIGRRMTKDRRLGLVARSKAGAFDFLQRGIFTHAVVHRTGSAPLPEKAQMVATIAAMEPGAAQLLYLDLGGLFRSRPATDLVHNPAIAVRGEVASSSAFIGEDAARNDDYTAIVWQQFVAGWWQHLTSRRINCFVPNLEQCPPAEEMLAKIAQFVPERLPS